MAWVRLDEEFAEHPKLANAGPLAGMMQVAALCYCNRHLTDGFIPRGQVPKLIVCDGLFRERDGKIQPITWRDVVQDMIDGGLWREVEGGYQIHDYLEFQPSKEDVLSSREQKREAGSKGGQAAAKARATRSAKAPAKAPAKARATADAIAPPQAPPQAESKPVPVSGSGSGSGSGPAPDPQEQPGITPSACGEPAATADESPPEVLPAAVEHDDPPQPVPRDIAVQAYDLLAAAGMTPSDGNWVGKAIGRIGNLRPKARSLVLGSLSAAMAPGEPDFVRTWISACDFAKLVDRYRGGGGAGPPRARAEPRGFAGIREFDAMLAEGGDSG